ncbi:hypothetical protein SAMN04488128_10499 [Chitinophaga eiseniae]|uniref:Uncharacterized protein n=1 Tax=Chitinophaga eiseniae TaxID=634771 RepID=A0A1T4T7D2_9BACT|nr:hypothetical protein SAMN04488128_10499 [Chitinophaga eiseniae]
MVKQYGVYTGNKQPTGLVIDVLQRITAGKHR